MGRNSYTSDDISDHHTEDDENEEYEENELYEEDYSLSADVSESLSSTSLSSSPTAVTRPTTASTTFSLPPAPFLSPADGGWKAAAAWDYYKIQKAEADLSGSLNPLTFFPFLPMQLFTVLLLML